MRVLINIMVSIKKTISIATLVILIGIFTYYILKHAKEFKVLLGVSPLIILTLISLFLLIGLGNGLINRCVLEPFNIYLSFKEWFGLAMTTGFYNLITPFKGGMLSKAAYLKNEHKFSYTHFLSSMIGVYVIQYWVVSLVGIFTAMIIYLEYKVLSILVLIVFLVIFVILSTIIFFKIKFPTHKNKIIDKIFEIGNGWNAIKNNKRIVSIAILVISSQVIMFVITNILLYKSIGVNVSISQASFLVTIGLVAGIVSITPGNLGVSEAVSVLSALVLGITPTESLSAAILNRVISMIVLFILGPIFSYKLIKKKK